MRKEVVEEKTVQPHDQQEQETVAQTRPEPGKVRQPEQQQSERSKKRRVENRQEKKQNAGHGGEENRRTSKTGTHTISQEQPKK